MEVFSSFQNVQGLAGAVVALGTFDGVHLGHQKVMRTALEKAAELKRKAVVVTFSAHPFSILCPEKEPLRLATVDQKIEYIQDVGMDGLIILPMTKDFLAESPEAFCQQLVTYLQPSAIVVGSNFTYGAKAAGNTDTLTAYMAAHHIPVMALHLLERPGRATPISSTVIRKLVHLGHMETATALLGRPFALTGEVVTGDQRGRTIGFPTANMLIPTDMAIPPDGVFITEAVWDGKVHMAMTNIGDNPTFTNQYRRIETHILDWHGDIYGKIITLRFLKQLRKEETFTSVEDLIQAMHRDEEAVRQYFANHS